jgi:hypothetical protein
MLPFLPFPCLFRKRVVLFADCWLLVVCAAQEKFLQDRIKVNGKTGNLAAGAGA